MFTLKRSVKLIKNRSGDFKGRRRLKKEIFIVVISNISVWTTISILSLFFEQSLSFIYKLNIFSFTF